MCVEIKELTRPYLKTYILPKQTWSSSYRPEAMRKFQVTLKTPKLYSANFASDPAGGDEATRVG